MKNKLYLYLCLLLSGIMSAQQITGVVSSEDGFKNGHIFIAGASETDIRYQIGKYDLIAIEKIQEVYCNANH